MSSVPEQDDTQRFDDAIAQMVDTGRYAEIRALSHEERHECPVQECNISAEEHHRLMFGVMSENAALRKGNPLADPMNPAYQRGFVAGARAILDIAASEDEEVYDLLVTLAGQQGYIP